jgi:hypothetical protein
VGTSVIHFYVPVQGNCHLPIVQHTKKNNNKVIQ